MPLENWIAFTVACIVLTLIPGPSVLLVVGQALTRGEKAAMMCVAGDLIGGLVLMLLSFLGVGAVLAASALLFQAVKWMGVLYLAYLGCRQIVDARKDMFELSGSGNTSTGWGSLCAGAVTAVLNPKAIVFYMAFLAQFIDPAGNLVRQMTILTATSTLVVAVLLSAYAVIAIRARQVFQSRAARQKVGYAGGTFLLGGSILIAASR
ncbi:LysE family translocator [Roseibium marinum]|uniref:Threonine/homoserine/homoserine lactone efflux protein n=1 Tax=Roseibium marinum TaxID=281252 RepID=A0A2S3V3U8_9HYPH|nr:LysE family translocator [Roseibium marinum]POF34585.1 threonine/homoserine/homoserine lactone efflux protein [Roseibium marinum]